MAVVCVVVIDDIAIETIGGRSGIALVRGLHAQVLSGLVARLSAGNLQSIDIVLAFHELYIPIRCLVGDVRRGTIDKASGDACTHSVVIRGAEENVVGGIARVVGVEVIDTVGHGARTTEFEAHGRVRVGYNGLRAPCLALGHVVARAHIIEEVFCVGCQCGIVAGSQCAILVQVAELLPLVGGGKV